MSHDHKIEKIATKLIDHVEGINELYADHSTTDEQAKMLLQLVAECKAFELRMPEGLTQDDLRTAYEQLEDLLWEQHENLMEL